MRPVGLVAGWIAEPFDASKRPIQALAAADYLHVG